MAGAANAGREGTPTLTIVPDLPGVCLPVSKSHR